jgi:phospholipid-binding lipoprotein MlaA
VRRTGLQRCAIPLAIAAAIATGCASTSPQRQEIHDSIEVVNRPVFSVNRAVDHAAFGPIARGYKKITPSVFRHSVSNAQRNLTFPQRFVSSLGQAEFEKAGVELGRFLVNSTVGIGGLLDPATPMGIPKYDEDLGKMLAAWHVPPGPYIVIPVLGPSTARDGLGDLASIALNPLVWAGVSVPPLGVLFAINRRAEADDRIRQAEAAALDYYVFARDAYIQRRTRFIRNEYVTLPEEGEIPDEIVLAPDLYDLPPEAEGAAETPGTDCATPQSSDTPTSDAPPPC